MSTGQEEFLCNEKKKLLTLYQGWRPLRRVGKKLQVTKMENLCRPFWHQFFADGWSLDELPVALKLLQELKKKEMVR